MGWGRAPPCGLLPNPVVSLTHPAGLRDGVGRRGVMRPQQGSVLWVSEKSRIQNKHTATAVPPEMVTKGCGCGAPRCSLGLVKSCSPFLLAGVCLPCTPPPGKLQGGHPPPGVGQHTRGLLCRLHGGLWPHQGSRVHGRPGTPRSLELRGHH